MIGKIGRLKRRPEFLRVAGTRRKWVTPGVILQAAKSVNNGRSSSNGDGPATSTPGLRVGFTVTRKVGNAVIRNRVRRRLRHIAQDILTAGARGGHDYVLIGRKTTITRSYVALREDLMVAIDRLGLTRAGRSDRP